MKLSKKDKKVFFDELKNPLKPNEALKNAALKYNSMKTIIKSFELQIDEKPNGAVIRINDETGCIIRICSIPKELVYDENGNIKKYIDITYPK